jgi:hypothetical protein
MHMAVTALVYGLAQQSLANSEIDFDTDTIKVMLCTSTYTPNQDTHRYKSSVTNEVTGTGYTARGATLANKAVTYTAGTNVLMLDADDPVWSNSTITARYAVFYKDTTVDATSPLICYWDFGADVSSTAAAFTLALSASGLVTLTAA